MPDYKKAIGTLDKYISTLKAAEKKGVTIEGRAKINQYTARKAEYTARQNAPVKYENPPMDLAPTREPREKMPKPQPPTMSHYYEQGATTTSAGGIGQQPSVDVAAWSHYEGLMGKPFRSSPLESKTGAAMSQLVGRKRVYGSSKTPTKRIPKPKG